MATTPHPRGYMLKSPSRFPRIGRSRRRHILLEGDSLIWLSDTQPDSEPLGTLDLDASSTVECSGTTLTVYNTASGGQLTMAEIDAGDAAWWAAVIAERIAAKQGASQRTQGGDSVTAPLLASQSTGAAASGGCVASSGGAPELLKFKEGDLSELSRQWGAAFQARVFSSHHSPL
eukprot:404481-Prymnesium_polylepis.1